MICLLRFVAIDVDNNEKGFEVTTVSSQKKESSAYFKCFQNLNRVENNCSNFKLIVFSWSFSIWAEKQEKNNF